MNMFLKLMNRLGILINVNYINVKIGNYKFWNKKFNG